MRDHILEICKHDILQLPVGTSPNFQHVCSCGQIEWVRFWGQKVRGLGYSKTKWSNKHNGRHFLACLQKICTYINDTLQLLGPHDAPLVSL